jgi:uncharacterized membrane-anchored protein YhcB (DUF1043 family)
MSDIFWFFVGLLLGCVISYRKTEKLPIAETLQNQIEQLEKDLIYYKNLCKWHANRNKHE